MKQFWSKFFANAGWVAVCFLLQGCSWFQAQKETSKAETESAAIGSVETDGADMPPFQPAPSPVRYEPKRPAPMEPMPMQPMISEIRPFQGNVYHVQQGDTLSSISEKFNVRLLALLRANNLGLHEKIYVGQEIVIPSTGNPWALHGSGSRGKPSKAKGGTTYRVKRGDTLESIARKFHVSINHLAKANRLKNKNRLSIGQRLTIPGGVSHKGATKASAPGTYRVKRGDTLFTIAKRHKMSVADLRQRNHLRGDRIRVGQILEVANRGKADGSRKKQAVVESPSIEGPSTESTLSVTHSVEPEPPAQPVESSDPTLSMTPEDQAWLEEGTLPVVPLEEVSQ